MSDYEEMARDLNAVGDDLDPHKSRRVRDDTGVPRKIPLQQAIKQVADTLNMPAAKVAEYAEELKQRGKPWSDPDSDPLQDIRNAIEAAPAQHDHVTRARWLADKATRLAPDLLDFTTEGVDLTPYIASGKFHNGRPTKPADRRTFRILGRPKHYVQVGGQLRLEDGESPWT